MLELINLDGEIILKSDYYKGVLKKIKENTPLPRGVYFVRILLKSGIQLTNFYVS